jgi:hypothetical protein
MMMIDDDSDDDAVMMMMMMMMMIDDDDDDAVMMQLVLMAMNQNFDERKPMRERLKTGFFQAKARKRITSAVKEEKRMEREGEGDKEDDGKGAD